MSRGRGHPDGEERWHPDNVNCWLNGKCYPTVQSTHVHVEPQCICLHEVSTLLNGTDVLRVLGCLDTD